MNELLETGTCECIAEPMGESGLEGYNEGDWYIYEHMSEDKNKKPYYRIYNNGEYGILLGYYETCGVNTFKKFFKIIKNGME
jgi:hypothetical protein